jgi:hypothetical protein
MTAVRKGIETGLKLCIRKSTRFRRDAALFLLMSLVAGAAYGSDNQVDFIIGASTPTPRPFLRDGAVLWAVLPDGDGYRLARRVASVRTFEYRNASRGNETFIGQRLVGPGADRALIHLPGSIALREGPVTFEQRNHVLIDYTFGEERTPPSPLTFRLADRVFRLSAEVEPAERGYRRLRVFLEEGQRQLELVSINEATDPYARLSWIGDIDRDGQPDFLLSVRSHFSAVSHRLFLSSLADAGQLCKHVGTVVQDLD